MPERRRAIISVSDKRGVIDFARHLSRLGFELISTGGTLRQLAEAGLPVGSVTEVTGFPEAFGGRVKTLHPLIHGGILFRRGNPDDERMRAQLGIEPIDLVVVNLYPFRETIRRPETTVDEAIEQIDIGGPTLIRAAAKNVESVAVVVHPDDYNWVGEALKAGAGTLLPEERRRLALRAFEHTAAYDVAISNYLADRFDPDRSRAPTARVLALSDGQALRYGENPHQPAHVYATQQTPLLGGGQLLQGKPLSYNNLLDLGAAIEAVAELDGPAAVIVKHTNPCGVGIDSQQLLPAYERALRADPQSAFGGIVALSQMCDQALATRLVEHFFEVIAAPEFTKDAAACLAAKKNLRVVRFDPTWLADHHLEQIRSTVLGMLVQQPDPAIRSEDASERPGPVSLPEDASAWRIVTERSPSESEAAALSLLWRVCKHVKSNAIVIGTDRRTCGIGAGQMSRVDAVRVALSKSTADPDDRICLASDAFFPFRDNIDVAAAGGIRAIIQPGGSRRDAEVIEAANEHGLAMVMTGRRHFRH